MRQGFARSARLLGALRAAPRGRTALLAACFVAEAASAPLAALALGILLDAAGLGGVAALAPALALFGGVLLLGHVATAYSTSLSQEVAAAVDGAHRAQVSAIISRVDELLELEAPAVRAALRETAADPTKGYEATPGKGAIAELRWDANLLGVVGGVIVVGLFAWWLPLIVLAPALLNRVLRSRSAFDLATHWRNASAMELRADALRSATTRVGEAKDLRLFGAAAWLVERMQQQIHSANEPLWRHTIRIVGQEWTQLLLAAVSLVPCALIVTIAVLDGHATIGAATTSIVGAWVVWQSLAAKWDLVERAAGANTLEARDTLDARFPARPVDLLAGTPGDEPAALDPDAPVIDARGIRFRYAPAVTPVLDGLDLVVRRGEMLAIVGDNGAGKSTLIKVLSGLYHPEAGMIASGGRTIEDIGLDRWRSRFGIVFQDFVKLELSVLDNVVFGSGRTAPDGAVDALARAGAASFAATLPSGNATPLSRSRPGGVDLSGGQWQQIALARVMFAESGGARVLVLDEPTAHLDVRAERAAFDRIAERDSETTVLLVSHRLSTVKLADRIAYLHDGRIVELGSHDELIELGGRYASAYAIQADRFREETGS